MAITSTRPAEFAPVVHVIVVASTDPIAHSTPPIVTERSEELDPKPKPILKEIY